MRKYEGKKSFICPLCRSKKYSEIWESNGVFGPGARGWIQSCECDGCSIHFSDPEKFSLENLQNKQD